MDLKKKYRLRANKFYKLGISHVFNCYLRAREEDYDMGRYLFTPKNETADIGVYLCGYAIVPIEDYFRLKELEEEIEFNATKDGM